MNPHKKQKLFPFLIMSKLNEHIGDGKNLQERSEEETQQLMNLALKIKDDEKAFDQMIETAVTYTDKEWEQLEQEYIQYTSSKKTQPISEEDETESISEEDLLEQESIIAKKGAKLKQLQNLKKQPTTKKKCSCGCELVSKKEAGGKVTTKCSCSCGGVMKEEGGKLEEKVKTITDKKLPKLKLKTKPMNAVDIVVDKMQKLKTI